MKSGRKKHIGTHLYEHVESIPADRSTCKKKGRGPPNRMNDLSYTTWMKFQKSFYLVSDSSRLFTERVNFFTKLEGQNGQPSNVALVSNRQWANTADSAGRKLTRISWQGDLTNLCRSLESKIGQYKTFFDFLFVDLWGKRFSEHEADMLLALAPRISMAIRQLLKPEKYAAVMCPATIKSSWSTYPLPWALAQALRCRMRLKDEKIALDKNGRLAGYDLYLHAIDDERPAISFALSTWEGRSSTNAIAPSWIIPKPPPRERHLLEHPAKFPETLIGVFIKLFSKKGELIFDPMIGTGSTAVAAIENERHCLGIELQEDFAETARLRITKVQERLSHPLLNESTIGTAEIICGDARKVCKSVRIKSESIDYIITSPPYWNMLRAKGSEGQRERRAKKLRLTYSDDTADFGNIEDYDSFLEVLTTFYKELNKLLKSGAYLTIIVKNMKQKRVIYPLAWDITHRLRTVYEFTGCTLWCQDDVRMKPFALGILWVSNIVHHYCLHFRKHISE